MSNQENNQNRIDPTKLFEIFNRQIILSEELLQILSEEKIALINMDIQGLIALSQKKEEQLTRLQTLDSTLQEEALSIWPDNSPKVIKLAALAPHVDDEEYNRLSGYRDRLSELKEKINDNNLYNKNFAEDTGKFLNDAIKLITSAVAGHPVYSTNGKTTNSMAHTHLLRREA